MKKNKKFNDVAPVIETNEEACIPGSVKEFKELLSNFPDDAQFTLNGNVNIDFGPDEGGCNIYPKGTCNGITDDVENSAYEGDIYVNGEIADRSDDVMKAYLTGIAHDNSNFITAIRETSTDSIINASIMTPNPGQLAFEKAFLQPGQASILNEIRHHNAYMAECLGELHRREISALLEYNTQCLAHFGIESNVTMCEIIDNAIDASDAKK